MSLKDKLFSFEGRLRRLDWWLWGIAMGMGWALAMAAIAALTTVIWPDARGVGGIGGDWSMTLVGVVTFLPMLWIQTALAAKRAHDRNKGAFIAVGLSVLSGVISFVPESADLILGQGLTDSQFNAVSMATTVGSLAINLYLVIVLGFLDGTPGPNRFGPSPKVSERPVFAEPGGMG